MIGYQRVLSGSGSSDKSPEMNLQSLPNPSMPEDFSRNAIGQFKENLAIVTQGIPRIPGVQLPADVERQFQPQSQFSVPSFGQFNQPPEYNYDPRTQSLTPLGPGGKRNPF